jgi:hypothetical protein
VRVTLRPPASGSNQTSIFIMAPDKVYVNLFILSNEKRSKHREPLLPEYFRKAAYPLLLTTIASRALIS